MLHQNSTHKKPQNITSTTQIQNLLLQQLHQTAQPSQLHQNSSNTRKKHIMQPHAAISNDFSIKNSSCSPTAKSPPSVCSYFHRLFYAAHAAQQKSPPSVCSPKSHAAYTISTNFSIKNSSCSPTAKSKTAHAASCSYFQRLFYQKQLMQPNIQLFPTTFLSKTAHAAQLPNPHPRYAAISIKNSSCSPTTTICSPTNEKKSSKQIYETIDEYFV
jgi:hypothetical protein